MARVDGVPILASAVTQRAALTGASARAALDDLIDWEVLELEARRRGYHEDPSILEDIRRTSVRVLLERTFERDFTPEEAAEEELEELYQRQRRRFVHPERRTVVHALAAVKGGAGPEERSRSRAWAERLVHGLPDSPLTPDEFETLARREPRDGVEVVVERLTTVRHGHTVEPFARATFDLGQPGSVSRVVETSFGYHVVYLVSVEPAENRTFAEVRAELLKEAWPELRRQAFERFVDEIRSTHRVSIDDSPLDEPSGS